MELEQKSLWREFFVDLFHCLTGVIDATLKVVADLAPEGYGDMYALQEETLDIFGPSGQMVTVASWLCIKEVSLLLGELVENVPLPSNDVDPTVSLVAPVLIITGVTFSAPDTINWRTIYENPAFHSACRCN